MGMDRPFIKQGTRVAQITATDSGSALVQRVCRIRPHDSRNGAVLQAAIGSPRFQAYVESDLTGVSVPHLSDEQISNYLVPAELKTADRSAVEVLARSNTQVEAGLNRQLELLYERRQSLITALVTGASHPIGAH